MDIIKGQAEQISELIEALKPLAAMAPHYPTKRTFGNRPTTGSVYTMAQHGDIHEASITVEDMHRAAALIAQLSQGSVP